jgi:hypothetical protein
MEKNWSAEWISDKRFIELSPINVFHKQLAAGETASHRPDLKNQHMYVRRTFDLAQPAGQAYLDISADDYYKLYINGRFVGQGPAPAYYLRYNYNRYEVSQYLRAGRNVIAVHVYYQGLVNRVWNSGDYRQGMIAELFLEDVLALASDSSWRYLNAQEYTGTEVFGYETQFVEDIDERLKAKGWKETEFDDGEWEFARENRRDDHRLVMQATPPVAVYERRPVSVRKHRTGHFLLDFGQEITGCFEMKAQGKAGELVEVLFGEELEEGSDGHVRYRTRCNCSYRDQWILDNGENVLEQFDYKAFRYVEIVSPEGAADPESFRAIVRHYPMEDGSCRFETSNPLLNRIWEICKNAVRYGSQEMFLDCPSREKGQYLGDATITSLSHLYLSGDLRLFRKELTDFAASSFICPGLMAVAPGSFMQEIADFSLQWPLQLLNYYQHSGDLPFLEEMYPVAKGIIGYFKRFQRADGLLENVKEKWNLVDWPDNLRDGYDFDLSPVPGDGCHNVINAFFCGAVKTVNEIEAILEVDSTEDFTRLKESFLQAFYRKESGLFADSTVSGHTALHSNIIPLFYGLVPEASRPNVVELIKKKGLCCGVYNAYFLLKGLAGIGEYELIYRLLTSEDIHSWGNMLKEGATTCFEAWGKDQKWNTSLCHPWASAPIPAIIEDLIGMKPEKPGWNGVRFEPHFPGDLEHLTFEMQTAAGRIKVRCEGGKCDLRITDAGLRAAD